MLFLLDGGARRRDVRPRPRGAGRLRQRRVAFDFFFVPPRFSFAVSDVQYLLTFAVMLSSR